MLVAREYTRLMLTHHNVLGGLANRRSSWPTGELREDSAVGGPSESQSVVQIKHMDARGMRTVRVRTRTGPKNSAANRADCGTRNRPCTPGSLQGCAP